MCTSWQIKCDITLEGELGVFSTGGREGFFPRLGLCGLEVGPGRHHWGSQSLKQLGEACLTDADGPPDY